MKLSVSIVTFQQASYVRQAVESVLAQKTDFDFEVVIGDDASTDGTQAILRELAEIAPDRIRLLLAEHNAGDGGLTNFMRTIDAARGDFIAFLDGDDFWLGQWKLQKQVDFLERHPECAICAHRVEHRFETGKKLLSIRPGSGDRVLDLNALLVNNFAEKIATVVRRDALERLPDWYRTTTAISADWLFNVLVSRDARVGYIDEVLAVHRLHSASQSFTHGIKRLLTNKLETLDDLRSHLDGSRVALLRARLVIYAKLLALSVGPGFYARLKTRRGRI